MASAARRQGARAQIPRAPGLDAAGRAGNDVAGDAAGRERQRGENEPGAGGGGDGETRAGGGLLLRGLRSDVQGQPAVCRSFELEAASGGDGPERRGEAGDGGRGAGATGVVGQEEEGGEGRGRERGRFGEEVGGQEGGGR